MPMTKATLCLKSGRAFIVRCLQGLEPTGREALQKPSLSLDASVEV